MCGFVIVTQTTTEQQTIIASHYICELHLIGSYKLFMKFYCLLKEVLHFQIFWLGRRDRMVIIQLQGRKTDVESQ